MHLSPLIEFIVTVNVPDEVAAHVKPRILDTLAVSIGARLTPDAQALGCWAEALAHPALASGATDWVQGRRWPVDLAAHLNAAYAHVLDYDDSHGGLRLHPSAIMLPALLALAEPRGRSLAEVGSAYAIGYQAMVHLAPQLLEEQYERGWHITTTLGALGTAAACARLLGLSPAQTEAAFGYVAAGFGSSRLNFGTLGKPYQVGVAAAGVVRAVLMAESGLPAGRFLTHPGLGVEAMYGGHGAAPDIDPPPIAVHGWAVVADPPRVKLVPTCFATHHAVAAAQQLRREGLVADDIAAVRVLTNATGMTPLIDHLPSSGTEARFSMPYVLARIMREGEARVGDFTDEGFEAHAADPLIGVVDAAEEAGEPFPRWAEVAVTMRNGAVLTARCEDLPDTDSPELLAGKVAECFAAAGIADRSASDRMGTALADAIEAGWERPAAQLFDRLTESDLRRTSVRP